jgi:hypothetical protein
MALKGSQRLLATVIHAAAVTCIFSACTPKPFRQLAFINTSDRTYEVTVEGSSRRVGPRSLGFHPASLGAHAVRFVGPSGKPFEFTLAIDRANKRGVEVDYLYIDITGQSRYLLLDCTRLYEGRTFMKGAVDQLHRMMGNKLVMKEFDGREPFSVHFEGNVEYAHPYEDLPRKMGWAKRAVKLVPIPIDASEEARAALVQSALF